MVDFYEILQVCITHGWKIKSFAIEVLSAKNPESASFNVVCEWTQVNLFSYFIIVYVKWF